MTTFAERNWTDRETVLGDPAENAFREWANRQHIPYIKYGMDRPPFPMSQLPAVIRYTPDFLTAERLYEVQGCGRDQTFKFKHDKLWALHEWHQHMDVWFWLWVQQTGDCYQIRYQDLLPYMLDPFGDYRVDGLFDGHKKFAAVTWLEISGGRWDVT